MKIKMIAHYHGQLSDDRHFNVGDEITVDDKSGKELVKRGKAEEVKTAKASTSKSTGNTK